jgi:putative DNA-invertase from lambdoid prophage Rac
MTKAAIWARVSTDKQEEANQVPALEKFCKHHGYEITRRYLLNDVSAFNGAHRETLKAAMDDAWQGEFSVLVVWSLDRISREGAEELLRIIRELRQRGCTLISIKEPWLNSSPEIQDVLIAFAGWVAQQESKRHSERIKEGIARARAEGKQVGGRKPGAKDRKPRRTDGYRETWQRRKATQGRTQQTAP